MLANELNKTTEGDTKERFIVKYRLMSEAHVTSSNKRVASGEGIGLKQAVLGEATRVEACMRKGNRTKPRTR